MENVFGLSKEDTERFVKFFRHAEIESKDVNMLIDNLDIQNSGRIGLLCYVFGRFIEKKEMQKKIDEMMGYG